MKKSKKQCKPLTVTQDEASIDIGRGSINHNFLAALVTSKAYKPRVVKAKKGKGAYQRKERHTGKGEESYLMAA